MDTKFITKKLKKYCKHKGLTNNFYIDLVTITTMFNVAKGEIKEKKDIEQLIDMMDVSAFSALKQDVEYEDESLVKQINKYSNQFSYPKTIAKILLAYLDAFNAHTNKVRFDYFYKMGKVDEKEQSLSVNLFAEFLDASRKLNAVITEGLKYNYSYIIEYARDSLKREE